MKNLTKVLLMSLIMVITVFTTNAQTKWQKNKAQEETDKLVTALDLDEKMSGSIYDIQLATYVKLKELNTQEEEGGITAEDRKVESKKIWKDNTANINAILGEELAAKYKAYRKEKQEAKNNE